MIEQTMGGSRVCVKVCEKVEIGGKNAKMKIEIKVEVKTIYLWM